MFTGLVEELGKIKTINRGVRSVRVTVAADKILADLKIGDSVAVNGACLTVVAYDEDSFTADVMPETVERTVLADVKPGIPVNLERTLKVGDRLGGHIVTGHIDGVGYIGACQSDDNALVVDINAGPEIMRGVVEKGSIAIDGISLTVVSCTDRQFRVSLIPHTAAMTTLGGKKTGDKVNLETDIIGKYVNKLLTAGDEQTNKSNISLAFLRRNGFI